MGFQGELTDEAIEYIEILARLFVRVLVYAGRLKRRMMRDLLDDK